jgi:transposase InsO family protein
MPWKASEVMSLRREFIQLATQPGSNIRELCRRFEISPRIGYKWLGRFAEQGDAGLRDRPRRPHKSPARTAPEQEALVVALRDRHRAWGGRKIRARMLALGHQPVPAASTVTDILRRHGRLEESESAKHQAWTRFEHEAPNDLWQMDFKGHFPMAQGRCHPLTVLDDHSRFSVGLFACLDERTLSVQARLTSLFRRYGLPKRILADNGSPWGNSAEYRYTVLSVWLLTLGIAVSHGRPYHPQTQGKDERFHRTLQAELLRWERFHDLSHCQRRFDAWRKIYNLERPHEALDMQVPASRYTMSKQAFPETLPLIEYGQG